MRTFRADLHIHTVLSPCGDLGMSPENIVRRAVAQNLDIIGITDHNSTRQCSLISRMAAAKGIFALCGAEITSREEVHCLAFMPDREKLDALQQYLDLHLGNIPNDIEKFGYQVVVDENENIVFEEPRLLIQSIDQSVEEIEAFVHIHGGIFIPAHVNRSAYSLISQLGFIPSELNFDALEISKHTSKQKFVLEHPDLALKTFVQNSDAHYLDNIGEKFTTFLIEKPCFQEIKMALKGDGGRQAIL